MCYKIKTTHENTTAGFTLVEIMIVVAIIGILAAIAIPQFATYRMKSFNSSALSDCKNTTTTEASLYASTQGYGISSNIPIVGPPQLFTPNTFGGPGTLITGPPAAGRVNVLQFSKQAGTDHGQIIGLGNGVSVILSTEVINAGTPLASSSTTITKHINGNTYYATDSDIQVIYYDPFGIAGVAGILIPANAILSRPSINDIAAANSPTGLPWINM